MTAFEPPSPRSKIIEVQLRREYSLSELAALEQVLAPAMRIDLNPLGHVCASTRLAEGADPTNYDAVWVRDSIWAYLGLSAAEVTREKARTVLRGILSYFATPAQVQRLRDRIADPAPAFAPGGAMQVLHIRFDGRSPEFRDVQVAGHDQVWNHKQNDAVALVALAAGEALAAGTLNAEEVPEGAWEFLLRLPTYWDRLGFDSMADAGAWEEIERINTSSVALVTSSLEVWKEFSTRPEWSEVLLRKASALRLDVEEESLFNQRIQALLDSGYARIRRQLPFESPDYPSGSSQYREADAALLNLVYPCRLLRLTLAEKEAVVESVTRLVKEVGILRYEGDAYQSAGYWMKPATASETDSRTDDHSTAEAFADRASRFIPGSEAQWFFDSWLSTVLGLLYHESGRSELFERQVWHWNRALCQITGVRDIGADGRPVPAFSLPESYNVVIDAQGNRSFAPSPITPLNWAKACLQLALQSLRCSTEQRLR